MKCPLTRQTTQAFPRSKTIIFFMKIYSNIRRRRRWESVWLVLKTIKAEDPRIYSRTQISHWKNTELIQEWQRGHTWGWPHWNVRNDNCRKKPSKQDWPQQAVSLIMKTFNRLTKLKQNTKGSWPRTCLSATKIPWPLKTMPDSN